MMRSRGRRTLRTLPVPAGAAVLVAACLASGGTAPSDEEVSTVYARWSRGPSAAADYFPIAVWLQDPANAARYRAAGINLYVGLWEGPTQAQLDQLAGAGMQVVCAQNQVGLARIGDPTIVGWMHGDEPDNAQWDAAAGGWGAPVAPAAVVSSYQAIRAADPSRPVLLNLGQGVAWDGWVGRGVRTGHPEDYPDYVAGADIVSFDIYPVASDRAETRDKLWLVPYGVERLAGWAGPQRPVWNCIECTRINSDTAKATPAQVRAEVWMALIHGSRGLIYFVHEWKPRFREAALLEDPEMLAAVTAINHQLHELAPVLNSVTVEGAVAVVSSQPDVPVAAVAKRHDGATYVFAVGMRDAPTEATFTLAPPRSGRRRATVIGEGRQVAVDNGSFSDSFAPYEVHLYQVY